VPSDELGDKKNNSAIAMIGLGGRRCAEQFQARKR
jgi:hypothetical protein